MLNRFNGNVEPFAVNATATNRTIFGDVTQSDDIDDNLNADFKIGWEIVGVNDNPTKQDFNALAYTLGNLVSYLYQQGIAVWNTNQKYYVGSRCIGSDGQIYKALTGTDPLPNAGNDPIADTVNWKQLSADEMLFDNTSSGLTAGDVQSALEELTIKSNPIGSIVISPVNSVPTGYLECDGATISRTAYADLFAIIGSSYGAGDGATTFNIPDLRGEFIRGFDNGRGVDVGRVIGTNQIDDNKSHSHSITDQTTIYDGGASGVWGLLASTATGNPNGPLGGQCVRSLGLTGSEARPVNVAMMYCIKY